MKRLTVKELLLGVVLTLALMAVLKSQTGENQSILHYFVNGYQSEVEHQVETTPTQSEK